MRPPAPSARRSEAGRRRAAELRARVDFELARLVDSCRRFGPAAMANWLAASPKGVYWLNQRASRALGSGWRWGWTPAERAAEYVRILASGESVEDHKYRPIAVHRRHKMRR